MHKTTAHTRLTRLIKKYNRGAATPQEAAFVEQYYAYFDKQSPLTESMTEEEKEILRQKMLGQVHEQMNTPAIAHRVHFLRTSWFRYAAAVILLVGGIATWYELSRQSSPSSSPQAGISQNPKDIQPGTNRAILTVGNKTIDLATNKTGIAVGNVITYTDGERIADAGQPLTLSTPRGGQYQATLPDGSKVWLNAASSIRFPSKFSGNTRDIEVTGEVYLEIAKNAKQPFYVTTRKTTIQVLGTSFNINAYENEQSEKTTLIEGSVRVISGLISRHFDRSGAEGEISPDRNDGGIILKPGQQAEIPHSAQDDKIKVINNQSEAAIAWKNGFFNLEGADLKQVMRQIERWYNITVKYEGIIPDIKFRGDMDRGVDLSGVLRSFSEWGIKTRLEGRTLIVIGD